MNGMDGGRQDGCRPHVLLFGVGILVLAVLAMACHGLRDERHVYSMHDNAFFERYCWDAISGISTDDFRDLLAAFVRSRLSRFQYVPVPGISLAGQLGLIPSCTPPSIVVARDLRLARGPIIASGQAR